jgi:nucleoside-diphosphate-sugar epimerase
MKPRSALVAGANGFIGSALVNYLVSHQVPVICLVREAVRHIPFENLPGAQVIRVKSYETDCLMSQLVGISAEVVYNLASYGVQHGNCEPDKLIEGNLGALTHLLQATAKWPLCRFVHTGSCSEYGLPLTDNSLISEGHPLRPLSLYGAAKAASVLFGACYAKRLGIPFVSLRLFGVYGTWEGPQRLIPYMIKRLRHNEPVDLTAGEQVRDFLFEEDVAQAFMLAGAAEGLKEYQTYNVCSSNSLRIRDVGETVAKIMDKPQHLLRWGDRPYRSDEPMWLVGDNRLFTAATGWRPVIGLDEGIRRMVDNARRDYPFSEHQHAV